jgi:tetratricopeptide (TPR) repeat protein
VNNHPDTSEFKLGVQARQLFDAGQFEAACDMLLALAENEPANACVRMDLATVLQRCGRLRDSTAQLLEASRLPSLDPAFVIQLARGLYFGGEGVAARACLERLDGRGGLVPELLAEQAHLSWTMGDIPSARRAIDRAISAGIDAPHAHHLQAMLMQSTGELGHAGRVLDACLQRWPWHGDAALARSNLRRQTPDAHHLEFLQRQLMQLPAAGRRPAEMANRAAFEAAMFKELDDLGRHDEAWSALSQCNHLMHQITHYDREDEAAIVDALIEISGRLGRRPAFREPTAVASGPQPIFIVGMPRSGTTLLDRMLSRHSMVASAGEITDFMRQLRCLTDVPPQGTKGTLAAIERSVAIDMADLGAAYLAQTQWRAQGRAHFVDKLPANIRMVAHIRQALPGAHILHMVRDPMDVCFSNLSIMFGNGSAYSYDQGDMAHFHRQQERLVRHWQDAMPEAMLRVAYADLVHDPRGTFSRILDYCGLPMEDECFHPEHNASPVATPSGVQVREPIHTRGLGRWLHYASQLGELQRGLDGTDTS